MNDREQQIPEPEFESIFTAGEWRVGRTPGRPEPVRGARRRAGRLAALSLAVTWLPLAVLAIIDNMVWGNGVDAAFFRDFLPYGQLLLAVPALILGNTGVSERIGRAVAELRRSDVLSPEDTPVLEKWITRAIRLWRGGPASIAILLLTVVATALSFRGTIEWATGDWQHVSGRLSLPAWWYLLVSLSVMRLLALQWLWRLMLWVWVLWQVSRLKLRPMPTHPDRAGGLAFLGGTLAGFGALIFAFGIQLSCVAADAVYYRGADLMGFKGELAAYVAIVLIVMLVPLLVFSPKMVRAREEYAVFLTGSGYRGAVFLDRGLRASKEGQLPADDVSGLTDFGPLFENARSMRPLPLEVRHVVALTLAAAAPFVPLLFLVVPAKEVLKALAGLVF
jgi:hypothetical protein